VPLGPVILSGNLAGFYMPGDDFEGAGIRSDLLAAWRPWDHFGFYGGVRVTYADVELDDEDIRDVVLVGPVAGIEFRY